MGQIVRKKRKGRPSNADLARRNSSADTEPPEETDLRRSVRRRNVKYVFDIDDYLDDDEYFEEFEDERKREKKLKHLLKLDASENESTPSRTRRVSHEYSVSASSDDLNQPSKRRRTKGEVDGNENENGNEENEDEDEEILERKREPYVEEDSVPGTPAEAPSGFPFPDKKTLVFILDKLQKKDIYGVYAKPVDPEELPDYHDVIEHPMDFATVRSKLANGSYANLEQFEADVFLICTNAMQYNTPDTIYHKQARSIKELAEKNFQKLRNDAERSDKELKPESNTKLSVVVADQVKKRTSRLVQEPVCFDFSSGGIFSADGDLGNGQNAAKGGPYEKLGIAEETLSPPHNILDKKEESLPSILENKVKGLSSRYGRKSFIHGENRRATYHLSTEVVACSHPIFSTFEEEIKQLIAVGLYADHSYARSLAQFAAPLGPVVWRVASKKIEQALPPGFKFGRGWIGEYEPLPAPVLKLENYTVKEPIFLAETGPNSGAWNDKMFKSAASSNEDLIGRTTLEGKLPELATAGIKSAGSNIDILPPKVLPLDGANTTGKPSSLCSTGNGSILSTCSTFQHQNPLSRGFTESNKKNTKLVELNRLPSANERTADFVLDRNTPEIPASRSNEMASRDSNPLSLASSKQPNSNGNAAVRLPNKIGVNNSLDINGAAQSSSEGFPNQNAKAAVYFPNGQEQSLSDPVQLMRMLTEKANQQKPSDQSPVDAPSFSPVSASLQRENLGNASVLAARAWMSTGPGLRPTGDKLVPLKNHISADSLYNPSRGLQPQVSQFQGLVPSSGMPFQLEKNGFPVHSLVQQPFRVGNEAQIHKQTVVFPQLVSANFSGSQLQFPWQNMYLNMQPRQKQEFRPPDLNIGFQSPGSPAKPSSGVQLDSQQPDLALQL